MCDCLNRLHSPLAAGLHHGDVERCPSCDTPWKLRERRRGTFRTREWALIPWWDIPGRLRAAAIPERWS